MGGFGSCQPTAEPAAKTIANTYVALSAICDTRMLAARRTNPLRNSRGLVDVSRFRFIFIMRSFPSLLIFSKFGDDMAVRLSTAKQERADSFQPTTPGAPGSSRRGTRIANTFSASTAHGSNHTQRPLECVVVKCVQQGSA